jgi:hypothetical protein
MRWLALILLLSGCSTGLPFMKLGGGGPNVAANTQVGKENVQQVVAQQERTTAGRDVIKTETIKEVEVGPSEQVTVNNENIPPWVLLLLLLGWLLPTPQQMGTSLYNLVTFPFYARSRRMTENVKSRRDPELGSQFQTSRQSYRTETSRYTE